MRVIIEGRVKDIRRKDEKKANDVVLVQEGEQGTSIVRVYDTSEQSQNIPEVGTIATFEGVLYAWAQDNGRIGKMIGVR